jgi:hypothetical protein
MRSFQPVHAVATMPTGYIRVMLVPPGLKRAINVIGVGDDPEVIGGVFKP